MSRTPVYLLLTTHYLLLTTYYLLLTTYYLLLTAYLASSRTRVYIEAESTYIFKGGGIGDFGGSSLEQLRPWQASQWPGPLPWEGRAARSCQARREERQETSSGTANGAVWPVLERR